MACIARTMDSHTQNQGLRVTKLLVYRVSPGLLFLADEMSGRRTSLPLGTSDQAKALRRSSRYGAVSGCQRHHERNLGYSEGPHTLWCELNWANLVLDNIKGYVTLVYHGRRRWLSLTKVVRVYLNMSSCPRLIHIRCASKSFRARRRHIPNAAIVPALYKCPSGEVIVHSNRDTYPHCVIHLAPSWKTRVSVGLFLMPS